MRYLCQNSRNPENSNHDVLGVGMGTQITSNLILIGGVMTVGFRSRLGSNASIGAAFAGSHTTRL